MVALEFAGQSHSFETATAESVTSDNIEAAFGRVRTSTAAPGKVVVLLLGWPAEGLSAGRDSRLAIDALQIRVNDPLVSSRRCSPYGRRHQLD
jgi:hypothetical protein